MNFVSNIGYVGVCILGGYLAEGDEVIQMAVDPVFRHGDVDFEPVEHREIKHKIERHEPDGMAGKPVSHGTHFLCLELEGNAFLKFLAASHYTPVIAQKQALNRTTSLKYL